MISAGLNSSGVSYETILVAIPTKNSDNTWSSVYGSVLHTRNYSKYVLPLTGGTLSGALTLSKAGEIGVYVENTSQSHKVGLIVGSSTGYGGLWDSTKSKWIVYSDTAGNVTLNGNANTATTASALTGFKITTTTNLGVDATDVN